MDVGWNVIGVLSVLAIIGGLFLFKGPTKRSATALMAVGVFGVIGAVFLQGILPIAPSASTTSAATPGGTFNVLSATTPALPTGCTLYTATNNVFCTVVFNSTSAYLAIQASVANTFHKPNYLVLPWNLIRTDNANTTFTEAATLSTVPTFNSLGATPTLYGPLGYKAATSSTPGQWQFFWDQGTLASQKPTVTAPSTSTNVITSNIPVKAFASQVVGAHISLAGGNSTSFPNAAAQAWANNTAQTFSFSFGNGGSASTWTCTFDLLGWNT